MRETLEMVTVLRMQNMVEIRKKNTCFVTNRFFKNIEKILNRKQKTGKLGPKTESVN